MACDPAGITLIAHGLAPVPRQLGDAAIAVRRAALRVARRGVDGAKACMNDGPVVAVVLAGEKRKRQ